MTTAQLTRRTGMIVAVMLTVLPECPAQLFEFCDDFTKEVRCQRNPYEERIETERHDFTQSAVTVGRGVLQVEAGYTYFYKDTEEEIEGSHTTPEMLVRVGLTEDIEFRLRTNYAWQFIDEEPNKEGGEDLRYTLKLQMTRQCGDSCTPTSALEIRGAAPTGGNAWSAGEALFGLDYIYLWDVAEGVTFGGSTGWGTDGLGDFGLIAEPPGSEHFNLFTQSAVLVCELSEQNTMYAEWFAIVSDGRDDELMISVINVGIDHYVTDDIVVDVRFGKGLSDDADDFFCGIGGGIRY